MVNVFMVWVIVLVLWMIVVCGELCGVGIFCFEFGFEVGMLCCFEMDFMLLLVVVFENEVVLEGDFNEGLVCIFNYFCGCVDCLYG